MATTSRQRIVVRSVTAASNSGSRQTELVASSVSATNDIHTLTIKALSGAWRNASDPRIYTRRNPWAQVYKRLEDDTADANYRIEIYVYKSQSPPLRMSLFLERLAMILATKENLGTLDFVFNFRSTYSSPVTNQRLAWKFAEAVLAIFKAYDVKANTPTLALGLALGSAGHSWQNNLTPASRINVLFAQAVRDLTL